MEAATPGTLLTLLSQGYPDRTLKSFTIFFDDPCDSHGTMINFPQEFRQGPQLLFHLLPSVLQGC